MHIQIVTKQATTLSHHTKFRRQDGRLLGSCGSTFFLSKTNIVAVEDVNLMDMHAETWLPEPSM